MSTSTDPRVRAEAWRKSLPEGTRPSEVDVAMAVGLRVTDPSVLGQLLWENAYALGQHWSGLVGVLSGSAATRTDEPGATEAGDETAEHGAGPDAIDEVVATASEARAKVRAYFAAETDRGVDVTRFDDDWVSLLQTDPEAAWATVPRRQQRLYKSDVTRLLESVLPSSNEPAADGFSNEPALGVQHRAGHRIGFGASEDGVELSWPSTGDSFTHYRIQAGYTDEPPSHFEQREVGRASTISVTDSTPLDRGLRHYAVWAYRGPDREQAQSAHPELWAEGTVLAALRDVRITSDKGKVKGTWEPGGRAEWVDVYRVPRQAHKTGMTLPSHFQVSTEKPAERDQGFTDNAPAGEYVYVIVPGATIGGLRVEGLRVEDPHTVVIPVPEATGLAVTMSDDKKSLAVDWEYLDGVRTEVHLSARAPLGEAQGRELEDAALERALGAKDTRSNVPAQRDGERSRVQLEWPADLPRLYVTLVTRVGDRVRVGPTAAVVRPMRVANLRLVERVDEQVLMFAWPIGADFVEVRCKALGDTGDAPMAGDTPRTVSRDQYDKHGGLRLPSLPTQGCTVAVTALAYVKGVPVHSDPVTLDYAGLTVVRYDILEQVSTVAPRGFFRRKREERGLSLQATSDHGVDEPLILVRRPDRIPLHKGDGDVVHRGRLQRAEGRWVWEQPIESTEELTGFVRLFVDVPDREQPRFAVLDPSVDHLCHPRGTR